MYNQTDKLMASEHVQATRKTYIPASNQKVHFQLNLKNTKSENVQNEYFFKISTKNVVKIHVRILRQHDWTSQ